MKHKKPTTLYEIFAPEGKKMQHLRLSDLQERMLNQLPIKTFLTDRAMKRSLNSLRERGLITLARGEDISRDGVEAMHLFWVKTVDKEN